MHGARARSVSRLGVDNEFREERIVVDADAVASVTPESTLMPGPTGSRIVDSGVTEGDRVGVDYDPLLAKLSVHAETRDAARARAVHALKRYPILGTRTNIPFLIRS